MKRETDRFSEQLLAFCRGKKRIFLYGSGIYGEWMQEALELLDVRAFAGFLSTHGTQGERPSIRPSDVVPALGEEDGIVFSFRGEGGQVAIARRLPCATLFLRDRDCFELQRFVMHQNLAWKQMELAPAPLPLPQDAANPSSLSKPLCRGRNILVIQLELTFGDMIWSTAFLRELRKAAGTEGAITMVIAKNMHGFMEGCPFVDRLLDYDMQAKGQRLNLLLVNRTKQYAEAQLQGHDIVFLPRRLPTGFEGFMEDALLALFSRTPIRIAHMTCLTEMQEQMREEWSSFFSVILPHAEGRAEANCDCDLLRAIGIPLKDEDSRMEYWLSEGHRARARKLTAGIDFRRWRRLIVVGIVSSVSSRCYSPEGYRWVFQEFPDIGFLILGGKDAVVAAQTAAESCNNVFDFTGKTTLPESAAIIEMCDMYLGSDTGLMHFAAAFGKPCVLVTSSLPDSPPGWTVSPLRTGPWLVPKRVIRPKKGIDRCKYLCSSSHPHCINTIPKERIKDALQDLLREVFGAVE